jgi:hypothetical protein
MFKTAGKEGFGDVAEAGFKAMLEGSVRTLFA